MSGNRILIVGGGAAGYFAAIRAAELDPDARVVIAEAGAKPLQKVAISGGGRCNVTHACFDNKLLTEHYPRGQRELRGPFSRFQPGDVIEWFHSRGVELKTEEDGRMFPVTDSSQTIIDCFEKSREAAKITLRTKTKVIEVNKSDTADFEVLFRGKNKDYKESFDLILIATGSAKGGYQIARRMGHTIEPCVPSLFTFEIDDQRLRNLSGVSVADAELELSIPDSKALHERGPLLLTHWGFSGPAVIRLSAWGAKALFDSDYRAELSVNWCPDYNQDEFFQTFENFRKEHPKRAVHNYPLYELPKRLWERLCNAAGIPSDMQYSQLKKEMLKALGQEIFQGVYQIQGKGVFKEEFVTCGGIRLSEVDLRSMESKLVPNLYFAGEVLDIDGITGGFNFQSAWTAGYIAGSAISQKQ